MINRRYFLSSVLTLPFFRLFNRRKFLELDSPNIYDGKWHNFCAYPILKDGKVYNQFILDGKEVSNTVAEQLFKLVFLENTEFVCLNLISDIDMCFNFKIKA